MAGERAARDPAPDAVVPLGGCDLISSGASSHARRWIHGTAYGCFRWRPWLNVQTAAGQQRVTYSAAQANGGQKIYIIPELDLVAVFTGGDYNSGGSPPNKIMARFIRARLLEARAAK